MLDSHSGLAGLKFLNSAKSVFLPFGDFGRMKFSDLNFSEFKFNNL